MTITSPIDLVSPVAPPTQDRLPLAPRLDTLQGKTIGLLDNAKPRANTVLAVIKEELERRGARCTVQEFKPHLAKPLPPEAIERLRMADAVVGAIGD
jgi:hypothetical protein